MTTMVLDATEERSIRARRKAWGGDRYDEVWEGVYMMMPIANNEHQFFGTRLGAVFWEVVDGDAGDRVYVGVNVSDREEDWTKNYRCPDVAVYLVGNPAKDCKTHWFGGPDFATEIVSPKDRARDKLDFYAEVGVHELLIIDRKPWALELYRLRAGKLETVGTSTVKRPSKLVSKVLPLSFVLQSRKDRPRIMVTTQDGSKHWVI